MFSAKPFKVEFMLRKKPHRCKNKGTVLNRKLSTLGVNAMIVKENMI